MSFRGSRYGTPVPVRGTTSGATIRPRVLQSVSRLPLPASRGPSTNAAHPRAVLRSKQSSRSSESEGSQSESNGSHDDGSSDDGSHTDGSCSDSSRVDRPGSRSSYSKEPKTRPRWKAAFAPKNNRPGTAAGTKSLATGSEKSDHNSNSPDDATNSESDDREHSDVDVPASEPVKSQILSRYSPVQHEAPSVVRKQRTSIDVKKQKEEIERDLTGCGEKKKRYMAELMELMRYLEKLNIMEGMLQSDNLRLAREKRDLEQMEEKERAPNQRNRGTSRAPK